VSFEKVERLFLCFLFFFFCAAVSFAGVALGVIVGVAAAETISVATSIPIIVNTAVTIVISLVFFFLFRGHLSFRVPRFSRGLIRSSGGLESRKRCGA
jgi:hypothetical protein